MKDISKIMDFDVYTDLKTKKDQYNIIVELEREVSPQTREAAIVLSGAIVRNYHSKLYKDVTNDYELAQLIKERLNQWIPSSELNPFIVNYVKATPTRVKGRE